jgi:hypothetical protein
MVHVHLLQPKRTLCHVASIMSTHDTDPPLPHKPPRPASVTRRRRRARRTPPPSTRILLWIWGLDHRDVSSPPRLATLPRDFALPLTSNGVEVEMDAPVIGRPIPFRPGVREISAKHHRAVPIHEDVFAISHAKPGAFLV